MKNSRTRVMNNSFVDRLRSEWEIDELAYHELREALGQLATKLATEERIAKDLALILYSMPQMVRNAHLHASEKGHAQPEMAKRLEEIWIELDALVLECLSE